jgi:hypothetical protein
MMVKENEYQLRIKNIISKCFIPIKKRSLLLKVVGFSFSLTFGGPEKGRLV